MSTPAELPDPYGTSSVKERLARFAAIGRAARAEQRAQNAAYDWWYENIPLPGMTDGDIRQWLDIAVDYNPFAALLQTMLLAAPDVDLSFALERSRQKGPTQ